MTIYYSAATGGLYHAELHEQLPDDCVEVSDAQYAQFQRRGFTNIVADADGRPQQLDAPPAPSDEELAALVRRQRDRLLTASDRYVLPDFPHSDTDRQRWLAYREGLRNLTQQAGFPNHITWPVAPTA